MYADKLLKLADIVERAVEQQGVKFDFNHFASTEKVEMEIKLSPTTTACMAGIAAISGEFPDLGVQRAHHDMHYWIPISDKTGSIALEAMMEVFELEADEVSYLFLPFAYAVFGLEREGPLAARHGVKRIRDFVAYGGMPQIGRYAYAAGRAIIVGGMQ